MYRQVFYTLDKLYKDADWNKHKDKFVIPLGVDYSNADFNLFGDLANYFNVTVLGATGSGKTTFLNGAVTTLLRIKKPEELKLILIDGKTVDLGVYEGIPHLQFPIIRDADTAKEALLWCEKEMERRSELMEKAHFVMIEQYNNQTDEKLPRIFIGIDECSGIVVHDVEFFTNSIEKICLTGNALGFNVMINTSRPGPEEVYPKRLISCFSHVVALSMASRENSMHVLHEHGAEELLNSGEMLYKQYKFVYDPDMRRIRVTESGNPLRHIQGYGITDEEVAEVVDKLKKGEEVSVGV
ncbi:MAG TPA: FtsK/SpoIIIE domain-containing protein [Candidatus Magasanikbacteria bacterium]|nr:FtsK/SpoIIIE domain-containing protein [Candidatus Magasanikbacteria bacterium]